MLLTWVGVYVKLSLNTLPLVPLSLSYYCRVLCGHINILQLSGYLEGHSSPVIT